MRGNIIQIGVIHLLIGNKKDIQNNDLINNLKDGIMSSKYLSFIFGAHPKKGDVVTLDIISSLRGIFEDRIHCLVGRNNDASDYLECISSYLTGKEKNDGKFSSYEGCTDHLKYKQIINFSFDYQNFISILTEIRGNEIISLTKKNYRQDKNNKKFDMESATKTLGLLRLTHIEKLEKLKLVLENFINFELEKPFSQENLIYFNFAAHLILSIENNALLLMDKFAFGWHPEDSDCLMTILYRILKHTDSLAIITSNSPAVIKQIPKHCVHILETSNDGFITEFKHVRLQTFGSSIESILQTVFSHDEALSPSALFAKQMADVLTKEHISIETLYPKNNVTTSPNIISQEILMDIREHLSNQESSTE